MTRSGLFVFIMYALVVDRNVFAFSRSLQVRVNIQPSDAGVSAQGEGKRTSSLPSSSPPADRAAEWPPELRRVCVNFNQCVNPEFGFAEYCAG